MIRVTRSVVTRWLRMLLHIDDTPQRTAAAFALGVFFGFSPWLGVHTVLALACAFALSLNRVAVLLGVYANLPWIIGPYYVLATAVGAMLIGQAGADLSEVARLFAHSPLRAEFWHGLSALKVLLWPYVLGSTLGSIVLAAVAYPSALSFVETQRRRPDVAARSLDG